MLDAPGRILLADDDSAVRRVFSSLLRAEGHEVEAVCDGDEAVEAFMERRHDLVLLDVAMPRKGGIEACREIRAADAQVPILFFTGCAAEEGLAKGLGAGADGYIEKMRGADELAVRAASALSRARARTGAGARGVLRLRGVEIDLHRLAVKRPAAADGGEAPQARLSRSEADMLRLLASEPGRVFSADEIFAAMHGDGYVGEPSAVRMLACRLREKLGPAGGAIVSARGAGYRLETGGVPCGRS